MQGETGMQHIPKVSVDELPVTTEFLREKRLIEERGELALISDGKVFRHLAYFSLKAGKGFYRGGHYHLKKVEHIYVISGELKIRFVDLDTGDEYIGRFRDGHRITIYPRCAHLFTAEKDAHVIEYYETPYDPDDYITFDGFVESGF